VSGSYRLESGAVTLSKIYHQHTVDYVGTAAGDGIPGTWVIRYVGFVVDAGEFHIWPDELAMEELLRLKQEEPVVV
jgi:hypothetical protein